MTGASEYHLEVYDDEALTNIVFQFTGMGTTITPTQFEALVEGQHWWRMQVKRGGIYGTWTPVWTFTITPPTTVAPKLTEPLGGAVLTTNTPYFEWQSVAGGVRYQIQIDNNDTFASPVQDAETQPAGTLSYTASPMPDGGKFYWRVRAINARRRSGCMERRAELHLTAGGRAGVNLTHQPDDHGEHHPLVHLEQRPQCGRVPVPDEQHLQFRRARPPGQRHRHDRLHGARRHCPMASTSGGCAA